MVYKLIMLFIHNQVAECIRVHHTISIQTVCSELVPTAACLCLRSVATV